MESDRLIVPFTCAQCGGNLQKDRNVCPYCGTAWEMQKRYNGPEIPDHLNINLQGWTSGTAQVYQIISNSTAPYNYGNSY